MDNYFNKTAQQTLKDLVSSKDGLSSEEALKRIEQYGPNSLYEQKEKSPFTVFLLQFKDLLVAILAVAALISVFSHNVDSACVIIAVLILNAVVGTVQQLKARKSLKALKTLSSPYVKVVRDNKIATVPSSDITVGDVVVIEAGDMIAADGRIIENHSLKVNESAITGESENVIKTDSVIEEDKLVLSDQKNMIFSGSFATYGRALAVITSVGMNTQLGKIAKLMNNTEQVKTPLQKSLDKFTKALATSITVIAIIVFLLEWAKNGGDVLNALIFAVALAVAAIPEALSSIVTIVQAMGTQKMVKEHAIIKDLKAVETLGSVNVICSDKTGTLTQNKMTVQNIYCDNILKDKKELNLKHSPDNMLIHIAALTNDSIVNDDKSYGDPTEIALVDYVNSFGIEEEDLRAEIPRIDEIPFDSDRKLMSTVHNINGKRLLLTKGALDSILPKTKYIYNSFGKKEFTPDEYKKIASINERLSNDGLRVLAFAFKGIDNVKATKSLENDFIFAGLISMMDPPRDESKQAVCDAKSAGIKTVMITGDHKITACAIAKRLSILNDGDLAVDGLELENMSQNELESKVENVSVYARVSPNDKIRIVNAWQNKGAIVSMTGDGVNDAPALKKADIGVSMGITGTEVAKDASSMILTDDNFATIIKAVQNGRNVYENIKNAVRFLLSGNMAAIIAVLFTVLVPGLTAPFTAVQLLFINLITDSLPALAIGMENSKDDLLKQPPRDPNKSILDRNTLASIALQGVLLSVFTLSAYFIGLNRSPIYASTFAFSTLSLARLFHGFNCRGKKSIFKLGLFTNKYSVLAFLAGAFILSFVLFFSPLSAIFSSAAISLLDYFIIIALSFAPTFIIQTFKVIREFYNKKQ